ncbi:hypothetical protein JoomaDRAFT_0743 [Galbibacter orientalis DSM 19592]|uniref:Uncharacterized protein n=1 Tax=Galbibacter orientalis DSM 19592 TaxID=926559 RepID=I3C2D4_9FLAO|nr:hypothetical protein [Galbibacter orientalis]EIJ37777.1 hypothetical protein JoomaDRAFT_0743 [Galbibacter orientalis DSM 19592]
MNLTKEKASELGKKSSRKGVPNKNTKEIRQAFHQLVSDKLPDLSKWLDEVAKENPEKAINIIIKLSDFVIPKLQRTEIELGGKVVKMTPEERDERIKELQRKMMSNE